MSIWRNLLSITASKSTVYNIFDSIYAQHCQKNPSAKSAFNTHFPKSGADLNTHLSFAHQQLQSKGYKGYYNAIVNACLSQVYPTLNYKQFITMSQRATAPLPSISACVMYSALYSMNHFNRFYHTLEQVMGTHKRTTCKNKTLHIYDYGCGQALASLALLSYIERHIPTEDMTLHFHLIEPSAVALEQGEALITRFASRIKATIHIHTYCMTLEHYLADYQQSKHHVDCQADQADQAKCSDMPPFNLHLFSNVLDIASIQNSIEDLVTSICSLPAKQLLIAVGPNFSNSIKGLQMLQAGHNNDPKVLTAINRFKTHSEFYSFQEHHWRISPVEGVHLALAYSNQAIEMAEPTSIKAA